jgi:hypothetical protein
MSVALRGSAGIYGKSGPGNRKRSNLRRTASLEDFLDQEKNDEQIEIQETVSGDLAKFLLAPMVGWDCRITFETIKLF